MTAKLISFGSTESIEALKLKVALENKRGIVYQHDPRHVDVLVKDLGIEQDNAVRTPATHDMTEEVARCLFVSQDRSEKPFIVKELCQRMSNPTQQSFCKR